MAEILCDRALVEELVENYDALIAELRVVYYNQDDEAIGVFERRINELSEQLGFSYDL